MDFLDFKSDNLLELRGPVDRTTGLPVNSASTCTALLFDYSKDTYLTALETRMTADAASAATVLVVASVEGFSVGDAITLGLDDGTLFEVDILTVTTTLNLSAPLPSASSAGNTVRRVITISAYMSVNKTLGWQIGDRASVSSDASSTAFTIERVVQVYKNFLLLENVPVAASSNGNSVASSLLDGVPITMTAFGTPFPTTVAGTVEGDPAWGFRGTLLSTNFDINTGAAGIIGLELGHRVRIEYTLVTVGGNMLFRKGHATVVNL